MSTVLIERLQPGLHLRLHTLYQLVFFKSGEIGIQHVNAILSKRLRHGLPSQGVVARDAFGGQLFNLPWADVVRVQLHAWELVGSRGAQVNHRSCANQSCEAKCEQGIAKRRRPHPPTSSSLPVTTPDATVTRARPFIGISIFVTPRLIGTSTVVFPAASLIVKLTTVPSGTAFPEQSRTGSVSMR